MQKIEPEPAQVQPADPGQPSPASCPASALTPEA